MVTSTNDLEIHASEELLRAIGASPASGEEELRFLLVAKLIELRKLSIGRGAEVCAMPLAAFMQKLGSVGVPVINYPAEELTDELRNG
ncbi:MAG: hypothetical protein A2138_04100 [Deltaproteobacteria bacterium RBG_16_71_12]|nr:MAG: hypothetical protein A2138_04100 [Deltaproteobacteria bacterium RBG_16_71_12]